MQISKPLNGVVVAPAGFGKTHRIIQILDHEFRCLVLTHTNVAVANLKRRAPERKNHRIETIDSFARRISLSYRGISGVSEDSTDWRSIREGAEIILQRPAVREALRESYSQVLVDEYQDCSTAQARLVQQLASILPTGVFGDPMQSLYDGMDDETRMTWEEKIDPWQDHDVLTHPWRWHEHAEQGRWVTTARESLEAGNAVRMDGRSNSLREEPDQQGAFLSRLLTSRSGTWAIIHGDAQNPNRAPSIAKAHRYRRVELAELSNPKELEAFATDWDAGSYELAVLRTGKECFSKINMVASFKTCLTNASQGRSTRGSSPLVQLVKSFATEDPAPTSLRVFDLLCSHPDTYAFRPDLLNRVRRALRLVEADPDLTMSMAVRKVQDQIKAGATRRPCGPVVGSVLRLKGLEFDHVAIIQPAGFMNAREVYVAISRAKRSCTVVNEPGKTLRWFTT